jgi:N-acetylglucosamine-6-sulfatase
MAQQARLRRSAGPIAMALFILLIAVPSARAAPLVEELFPDEGPVGAPVTITGSGLSDATEVSFSGVVASFTVVSGARVDAVVPPAAVDGPVTVATPEGTVGSPNDFHVQPNVVVIMTDDQRWDTLDAMPVVSDEIAAKGTMFRQAFVVNADCCPSRVSFLTGRYSHSTGVWGNAPPNGGFPAFTGDDETIATWLDADGYRTALVGKYLNSYLLDDASYVPPGWDRWFALVDPKTYLDYDLSVDGSVVHEGAEPKDYSTGVLGTEAADIISSTPTSEPLFLWFAPFAPHKPADPADRDADAFSGLPPWRPASFNEREVRDKPSYVSSRPPLSSEEVSAIDALRQDQLRTLLSADRAVASILRALGATGRLGDTMIVFTSDNGFLWGEHRLTGKLAPYEESIRVPFVVRWDRLADQPSTDAHLVTNLDLAPTVAAVTGATAAPNEGLNLTPLLSNAQPAWRHLLAIERPASHAKVPGYCAVRTRSKLFVHYATGEEELYGLTNDPLERANLAAVPGRRAALDRLREQARVLCSPLPPGVAPF